MIALHLNMQGANNFERTNGKCHVFTFSMQEEVILEHTNAECDFCTLWLTCRPLCNRGMHLVTLLNILMPRYVTYGEVTNHQCNLAYTSKVG